MDKLLTISFNLGTIITLPTSAGLVRETILFQAGK
jgi:hypothetical protein